jgi:hypothetical protein
MLAAYLDESMDDKVYAVSGFLTTAEKWLSFSPAWEAALKADPPISHFKMNDVFGMKEGPFQTFSTREQRIEKTEALISVINTQLPDKTDLAGSVVLDFAAYQSMLEPILSKRYRNPYLWCFQGILVSYSSFINQTMPGEKIDFIFDDNQKPFRDALRQYTEVADLPGFVEFKDIVGSVTPGNDMKLMPLQAADMLAGQTRLYGTGKATFMDSISKSDRTHMSYLLGKNKLAAIRAQIDSTAAWLQEFTRSE